MGGERSRGITEREREILKWLKAGKDTWDISTIMRITQRTVHFHVQNLKKKLDVSTRAQAVAVAIERELIDRG
ncbi:MAG: helix-turn-helix transcriptional regulator [Deltaproteobacteria bacterium]|nr:helix-turn-helix transcriptional regulator [Deltaproteobacteria bacterium]